MRVGNIASKGNGMHTRATFVCNFFNSEQVSGRRLFSFRRRPSSQDDLCRVVAQMRENEGVTIMTITVNSDNDLPPPSVQIASDCFSFKDDTPALQKELVDGLCSGRLHLVTTIID